MNTSLSSRRKKIAIAAIATLALALTGCASAGGSKPNSSSGHLTLNVGQISNSVAFFPIFVAENQGFFADENLTLGANRPRLGTGAKLAAALESGSIDVAGGVMTDAFNLYQANGSAQVVGSLVNSYYVDIVVGSDFKGPATSASLASRITALKGKKIGITGPGSGTEALVDYLLLQQGLNPKTDVTLVNLGSDSSAALGALKAHLVDALSFFQPIGQQAEATNVGKIYISPTRGDVPKLTGAMHGVVFSTKAALKSKGPAISAFLRGIQRAEVLIHNASPVTLTKLLAKYQVGMNPATLEALVPILQKEIPASPLPTETGFGKSAAFHKLTGLVTKVASYTQIVPLAFIAKSLK